MAFLPRQDPYPVQGRDGAVERGRGPFLNPTSLVPWCKGPQEQQLLSGEGSFCLSLGPSSPGAEAL